MRTIVSLLLLVTSCFSGHAQQTTIERIDIVDAGVFRSGKGKVAQTGTPTGNLRIVANWELISATTTIQPKIGMEFGFQYLVVGKPQGQTVTLRSVTLHPRPGLRLPGTGNSIMRGESDVTTEIGAIAYRGYRFDQEWELVPGTWTFELWDGQRK